MNLGYRHIMKPPKEVFVPKLSLSALLTKRKYIMSRCSALCNRIDKMRTSQNDELKVLRDEIKQVFEETKAVGKSQPEYFKGDLLDINNYIKYGDFFFYGKPLFSTTNNLMNEINERLSNYFGKAAWNNFDNNRKQYERKKMIRLVIDEKTKTLECTKKINEKLDSYQSSLNALEEKIESEELKRGIETKKVMTKQQEEQFMRLFK